jgi:NAD(P)-dependent dehydrogenase (short-subunit alcohol dehydrogenase family)
VKTIVITGATSGIGLEVARLLTAQGFRVLGVGRAQERCAQAEADIRRSVPDAQICFYVADLMQLRQVRALAKRLTADLQTNSGGALHALINNAGCARSWYMTTEDGYEQQFALNYLSAYLLTHELLSSLLKAKGRVLITGSQSHRGIKVHWDDVMLRRRYNPLTAYKQSKLCDLLLAQGFNDRYAAQGIRAYAVDPGLVRTDIGDKTGGIVRFVWKFRKRHGVSPTVPAKTYAYLCSQAPMPLGLYYAQCQEKPYSKQVTSENASRLFALSAQLCGVNEVKTK